MTDNNNARASRNPDDDFPEDEAAITEIRKALEAHNLPEFYANSFTVNLGTGDVMLIMNRNGKQVGVIQVSYTVAKSLAEAIFGLLERLEARTGSQIMTSKFIASKMLEEFNDESDNDIGY